MKRKFIVLIVIALFAVFVFTACAQNNTQPSVELKGPSVSLPENTPSMPPMPSSTVTIDVTPLPLPSEY